MYSTSEANEHQNKTDCRTSNLIASGAMSTRTIYIFDVRIMWALPMHYPGHFPHCTQEIIMDFFYRKSIINCLSRPLLFA